MKVITRKRYYPINLKSSSVVIAIAQIEGPLPNGKHNAVIGDRESFEWQSITDMDSRINKACEILDQLNKLSQKPNIVVFPEYSLPLLRALPRLQEKSDQYNQIIIGGADSIHYPEIDKIYNRCPIILPGKKEPLWITKRNLSQWEHGKIDQPDRVSIPILTWKADGHDYWISIHICMDFLLAPLDKTKGPGIFIVPMCSPETNDFRVYADTLLRAEAGTVTVLCNCVGGSISEGRSGVSAVVPGSGPLRPAIDMPELKEGVAVFEIDCKRLAPPKKTVPGINPPLGKHQLFLLRTTPDGIDFIPLSSEPEDGAELVRRAVVNPSIFYLLGKKMRLAFLEVTKYSGLSDKIKNQDFEVLAILGQHDVLVTHLHEDRRDMIFDITQSIPLRNIPSEMDGSVVKDNFPFFRVDVFFKVLGTQVSATDRAVFDGPEKPIPSLEELAQLLRLANNWDDEDVPQSVRDKFLSRKWVLDITTNQPGKINVVMTITLDYASGHPTELHRDFEERVLPELASKPTITSIYRGRGLILPMHYVLRITSDVDSLFGLIDEVHDIASNSRVLVTTSTYVVVKKLSNLSLEKAVLLPVLPVDEANYRNAQILPRLSDEDRVRAIYLPQNDQRTYIQHFRTAREAIIDLGERQWLQGRLQEALRKLAIGLLHNDFADLKEAHDLLQHRVEKILSEFIEKEITDQEFEAWKSPLSIPPGRKKGALTYAERIRLVANAIEDHNLNGDKLTDVRSLTSTTQVRNAFAHGDWEEREITIEMYVNTLKTYCTFIAKWES